MTLKDVVQHDYVGVERRNLNGGFDKVAFKVVKVKRKVVEGLREGQTTF